MPLIHIHIRKGRTPDQVRLLCDAIHAGMVEAFGVPVRDRYQIVHEHDAHMLIIQDTGLDIPRTDEVIAIGVVSRPRSLDAKLKFYELVCKKLHDQCGIASSDVLISITTNTDADWSFGYGRAQFITGEL